MKLYFENNTIPVFGWSDLSISTYYKILTRDVDNGLYIVHNTPSDFEDGELCAYIFYKDFGKKILHTVYIGEVEFISSNTDYLRPFTFKFYPLNRTKVKGVGYCECCGEPEAVMLKNKKL